MKNKQEIINSINHLTCILNSLKSKIDDNEEYNNAYNNLLIKRAQLRKQLTSSYADNLINLFKRNLNCLSFKKKERLICDYFSSGKI